MRNKTMEPSRQEILERLDQTHAAWRGYSKDDLRWSQPFEGIACAPGSAYELTLLRAFKLAQSGQPLLLDGPTGAGKSELAQALHCSSGRPGRFVQLSSADLLSTDGTLIRGRLAGYGRHHGLIGIPSEGEEGILQEADKGTLLIDEVADLSGAVQHYLLLILDGKPLHQAAGVGRAIKPDVRFIFATNRNLAAMVEDHSFRRDLYERIKMCKIVLPPLEGHPADIAALIAFFSARFGNRVHYSEDLFKAMLWYSWPGNVRELKLIIQATQEQESADQLSLENLSATAVNDEVIHGLWAAHQCYQEAAERSQRGEREERLITHLVRLAEVLLSRALGRERENPQWDWQSAVLAAVQEFKVTLAGELAFTQAQTSKSSNCLDVLLDCYGQKSHARELLGRVFKRLVEAGVALSSGAESPRYTTLKTFLGLSRDQLRYAARRAL